MSQEDPSVAMALYNPCFQFLANVTKDPSGGSLGIFWGGHLNVRVAQKFLKKELRCEFFHICVALHGFWAVTSYGST